MVRRYVKSEWSRLTACYILLCGLVLFHVGMDTGTSAGPSLPRAAAQRKPFANQLADGSAYHTIFQHERKHSTQLLLPSQSTLPKLRSFRAHPYSQRRLSLLIL